MSALTSITFPQIALVLGLSLFFGFAFEQFYANELPGRPGGARTFPLLALAGTCLYLVEPRTALAFIAGLIVVGAWIFAYLRQTFKSEEVPEGHFVVPVANILAYVIGPIAITQPLWLSVSVAVAAVLLMGARARLHQLAQTMTTSEYLTLGQFLILIGIVLPLAHGAPPILNTGITPFKICLAVAAVSTISYASYLAQRFVFPGKGVIVSAILGGMYSSTATTVVLSQKARTDGVTREIEAGVIAASAMMYLRVLIVCLIFNIALGRALAPWFVALALGGLAVAALCFKKNTREAASSPAGDAPKNPLQIGTALVFAVLLVVISLAASWVHAHLGRTGVLALAALVGFSDIDPFVLSLAQGGVADIGLRTATMGILIATSSNNTLKALYAASFSRKKEMIVPVVALLLSAVAGVVIALAFIR